MSGIVIVRIGRRMCAMGVVLVLATLSAPWASLIAEELPVPRCPAESIDTVFLPCGEVIAYQPAPGVALTPFTGAPPPSDGPLLDLTSEAWALHANDGMLEAEFRLVTGMPDNPMLVGSRPWRVTSFVGQDRLGAVVTSYNGHFPGPMLMVAPGDTIRLDIVDERIPDSTVQASPLTFDPTVQVPEASNFHAHGLLVSPMGEGDNIYRGFLPGNRYRTEIAIPADHSEGVNWYHPHVHGSTAPQVYGGLAGLLQIGVPLFADHQALIEGLAVRYLVFSGMTLAPTPDDPELFYLGPVGNGTSPTFNDPNPIAAEGAPREAPDYRPTHFINGQLNPTIAMRPNETQVWVGANVNAFSGYELALVRLRSDGTVDPETPLFRTTLLEQDGNEHYTPYPGYLLKYRDALRNYNLGPGQRLTWTVTAPEEAGTYYLINATDYSYTRQVDNRPSMLTYEPPSSFVPSMVLATVEVAGEALARDIPEFSPTSTPDEVAESPDVVREIAFDFEEHTLRGRINFGYFPNVGVVQSYSGDVETWIMGTYSAVAHPFHIHQGDFTVERIEFYANQALTQLRTDLPENPVYYPFSREMDTFILPSRSKVYLKLRASAFTGKFVFHCHVLLHEDSGMMASVAVSPPRDEEITVIASGPGGPPLVTMARADTGTQLGTFQPFETDDLGGVSVDVGNPLGGYRSRIAVAGLAGVPTVWLYDREDTTSPILQIAPFGGAGNGATVALGDIDGDAIDEIVIGSGPGTTPSVAIYDVVDEGGMWKNVLKFEVPVFNGAYVGAGVRVAAADVDGDNWDDIVAASGPGARNRVVVLSGQILSEAVENTGEFAMTTADPALDRELKLSICSATGNAAIIVDVLEPLPGTDGLNVTADMLGGGFATYPPITDVGYNPVVDQPYRAMVALTRATAAIDPEVGLFAYARPGGHEHVSRFGDPTAQLRPVALFTPFPGESAPAQGLSLATGLTALASANTPITGLVAARNPAHQTLSFFDMGGDIQIVPYATAP